jgi:hypothetical protein
VNTAELCWLAGERLREARALLGVRCWSGAYYLAGYAVECGLKACIIKYLMATDQFPERKFSEQCWTHDIEKLVGLAGLLAQRDADAAADTVLAGYWGTVRDWTEVSRYTRMTKSKAELLYNAIADKKHGVFAWIKSHW